MIWDLKLINILLSGGVLPASCDAWVAARGGRQRVVRILVRLLKGGTESLILAYFVEYPDQPNEWYWQQLGVGKSTFYTLKKSLLSHCLNLIHTIPPVIEEVVRHIVLPTLPPSLSMESSVRSLSALAMSMVSHAKLGIIGPLGVGKTTLALKTVYRERDSYIHCIYISLASCITTNDILAHLIEAMELDPRSTDWSSLMRLLDTKEPDRSLMIFDDCMGKEIIINEVIKIFQKYQSSWNYWCIDVENSEIEFIVPKMTLSAAYNLFVSICIEHTYTSRDIEMIVKNCDYNPLTIERIASIANILLIKDFTTSNIDQLIFNYLSDSTIELLNLISWFNTGLRQKDMYRFPLESMFLLMSLKYIRKMNNRYTVNEFIKYHPINNKKEAIPQYISIIQEWIDELCDAYQAHQKKPISLIHRDYELEHIYYRIEEINLDVIQALTLLLQRNCLEDVRIILNKWAFFWFLINRFDYIEQWVDYISSDEIKGLFL